MALRPYTLIEPVGTLAPLVVDSPHSGHIYPVDFAFSCPLNLLRQAEDAFVDEVVAGAAQAGAVVIAAEFPRSMIDVNRAETDIDPALLEETWPAPLSPDAMTLAGFGLVRRLCRNGVPLYKSPLSVAEVQRRLDVYYRPYHRCLHHELTERAHKFGTCLLINAHSMPDRVENGVTRSDFILGDREGTTCNPNLTKRVQKILQNMGYRVTLNDPYKGKEIVLRHGLAGEGAQNNVQALQVEINRRLYMDEMTISKHQGFPRLQDDMTEFFATLAATLHSDIQGRAAAE